MRLLLTIVFVIAFIFCREKVYAYISPDKTTKYDILLMFGYIVAVLVITIGIRSYDDEHIINLHPIETYQLVFGTIVEGIQKNAFIERFSWVQAALEGYALNILLFVPFGFLIPYVMKECNTCWIVILIGFAFSLFIELIQLITHLGWFDTTDIIHNTIGSFIGYKIFTIIERR